LSAEIEPPQISKAGNLAADEPERISSTSPLSEKAEPTQRVLAALVVALNNRTRRD